MKTELIIELVFTIGLGGFGFGLFLVFGLGWSLISCSTILMAISIWGALNRDNNNPSEQNTQT